MKIELLHVTEGGVTKMKVVCNKKEVGTLQMPHDEFLALDDMLYVGASRTKNYYEEKDVRRVDNLNLDTDNSNNNNNN